MLKFSIRDVALATVIVALTLGWWLDHRRQSIAQDTILRRLTFVDDNLFQLVAWMNAKGMGITADERGYYSPSGPPGPHRSRIDGLPPEPSLPATLRPEPGYTTAAPAPNTN